MTIRRMVATDLFKFNLVNLDRFTDTFHPEMYFSYLEKWPSLCLTSESQSHTISGYLIGKVEGMGSNWHGHITAISVAPQFRRCGLARSFLDHLENSCNKLSCYFIDLFVRISNAAAIKFYEKLGYHVWRRLPAYYGDGEDAYDMRKPLQMDPQALCLIPDNSRELGQKMNKDDTKIMEDVNTTVTNSADIIEDESTSEQCEALTQKLVNKSRRRSSRRGGARKR